MGLWRFRARGGRRDGSCWNHEQFRAGGGRGWTKERRQLLEPRIVKGWGWEWMDEGETAVAGTTNSKGLGVGVDGRRELG